MQVCAFEIGKDYSKWLLGLAGIDYWLVMVDSLTFLPFVGPPMVLPFAVSCEDHEIFGTVVARALQHLAGDDPTLLPGDFDISTGSADIPVPSPMFEEPVAVVVDQYGAVFSLKTGTTFHVNPV